MKKQSLNIKTVSIPEQQKRNASPRSLARFASVLSPLNVNGLKLPNRLFFPSMGIDMANLDGTFSSRLGEFYNGLVESGCGLVVLSNATVSANSVHQLRGLRMYEDRHAEALAGFIAEAAAKGVTVGVQLQHYGGQAATTHTGMPVLTPSGIGSTSAAKRDPQYRAVAMSLQDIETVRNEFAHAAHLAAQAGARFIQLQASNGYLLSSFLSPRTNRRTDAYGGDPQRRALFVAETVRAVRNAIPTDVVLGVRLQADDCMGKEGLTADQLAGVIPLLENAGVDIIEASMAVSETFSALFQHTPAMADLLHTQVKKIKSYARIPVGFAGFVDSLETAEKLVASGTADMVGMARALFADNDLIRKTLTGKRDEIHWCLWDGNCFRDKSNPAFDRVYCCVNPKYMRPGPSSVTASGAVAEAKASSFSEEGQHV
jgi:2,4-dienoyl-CoA reductase-like NADH-dependent reductase (Old Yellow Enzyme family)